MEVIKMNNGTLTLPPETAERIGPDAEFTMITAGDTIILKKVTPTRLTEIAERAPKDKPMSLSEISSEAQHYRRGKRANRH